MKAKKVLFCVLLVVLPLAVVFSAGQVEDLEEVKSLKAGYLSLPHYLLVPYLEEHGYDEDFGVDVEPVNFTSGPPMISALITGDIDIGLMGMPPVITSAISSPDSYYMISVFEDTTSVMSLASQKADINSLEDLEGKQIVLPFGTGMHFFTELALSKAGLSTKDVELTHAEPADSMYAMMSGAADATSPFGGHLFSFLAEGGWSFFWGYELWETEPVVDVRLPDVIVVNKKFADNNPEAVVAFLNAFYKAVDDASADLEAVVDWEVGRMNEMIGTEVNPTLKKLFTQRPTSEKGVFEDTPSWVLWSAEEQAEIMSSGLSKKWMLETGEFFEKEEVIDYVPDVDKIINSTFIDQVVESRKNK